MITDILKTALANHIECANTIQGYHWNIEGSDFPQFHEFFGDVYEDYYAQVDVLAEYIRIVSNGTEYVNPSIEVTKLNKVITGVLIVGNKPVEMCKAIIDLNNQLVDDYNKLFTEANKENNQGLANYCASRLEVLSKTNWKIVSITKNK